MITYRVVNLAISRHPGKKSMSKKTSESPRKMALFAAIRPRIGLENLKTERTVKVMGCFGTTRQNAGKQGQNAVSTLVNSCPPSGDDCRRDPVTLEKTRWQLIAKTRKLRFENVVQETIRRQAKTREIAEKTPITARPCGQSAGLPKAIYTPIFTKNDVFRKTTSSRRKTTSSEMPIGDTRRSA